jgi:RHS repeat-associated protein
MSKQRKTTTGCLVIFSGFLLCGLSTLSLHATGIAGAVSTVYVNKHFEIRDHASPTKYVFNGDTRVARVTGSLSSNVRIQRLTIFAGWNLCSLAVTATNTQAQLANSAAIQAVYRWVSATGTWASVANDESLSAGTVLWLHSSTNITLSVVGPYVDPPNTVSIAGSAFMPAAGLQTWVLGTNLPPAISLWKQDPTVHSWKVHFPAPLESSSDFPEFVSPGEAIFAGTAVPVQLLGPDSARTIEYYHQDHLGSSGCLTDASGNLVEANAFYPFGQPRQQMVAPSSSNPYAFTQMEHERETGLEAFPARYCDSLLARFLQPDSLGKHVEGFRREALGTPQKLGPYAYVRNNPVKYVDPTGLEETPPATPTPAPQTGGQSKPVNLNLPASAVTPATTTQPNPITSTPPATPVVTVTVPAPQPGAMDRAEAAWREAHGEASAPPKAGSAGDVATAVGKVQVNGQSLQDRATGAVVQPVQADWARAKPGEKAAIIATGVIMAGVAAPALQNKEVRAGLQAAVPKVEFAVPLGKDLKLGVSVSTTKPEGGVTLGGRF